MTKLEERLKQLLSNFEPFNYGNSDDEQRDAFVEGFKAALELPELKALVVALDKYGNSSEDVAVSMPFDNLDPDDFPIVEEFESGEPEDFGTKARQVITKWRSFVGEVGNEEKL